MSGDRHDEIPFVPGDELRQEAPLAPGERSMPDAHKQRLEALLRELLRDNSVRELLCNEEA